MLGLTPPPRKLISNFCTANLIALVVLFLTAPSVFAINKPVKLAAGDANFQQEQIFFKGRARNIWCLKAEDGSSSAGIKRGKRFYPYSYLLKQTKREQGAKSKAFKNLRGLSTAAAAACVPESDDNLTPIPTPTPTPAATPSFTPTPQESAEDTCTDGIDNNSNGIVDDPNLCEQPPYTESDIQNAVTSDGWKAFFPSSDTRIIFVSSSLGNDANDGLSRGTPKRTIAAGVALLRNGYPDWLLLRRGDTFDENFKEPGENSWEKGGRSESEPMLLGFYGRPGARPLVRTGGQPALTINSNGSLAGHILITGIEFSPYPKGNSNPNGITLQRAGLRDITIEDCKLTNYNKGIVAQINNNMIYDLELSRNIVAHMTTTDGSHAQGVYVDEVDGFRLSQNVIDDNGGDGLDNTGDGPDIFKHGVYIQGDGSNVEVEGNVITNSSSHGVQVRTGGVVTGNFITANPIGALLSGGAEQFSSVQGNLFYNPAHSIGSNLLRGDNLHVENVTVGASIGDNTFIVTDPAESGVMINVLTGNDPIMLRDVDINNNVFRGAGRMIETGNFAVVPFTNFHIRNNDLQQTIHHNDDEVIRVRVAANLNQIFDSGNRYWSLNPASKWVRAPNLTGTLQSFTDAVGGELPSTAEQISYPSARTPEMYYATVLGQGATLADFLARAKQQSRLNWDPRFTAAAVIAYVREGYGQE